MYIFNLLTYLYKRFLGKIKERNMINNPFKEFISYILMMSKSSVESLVQFGALDDLVGPAKLRRDRLKRPPDCS